MFVKKIKGYFILKNIGVYLLFTLIFI